MIIIGVTAISFAFVSFQKAVRKGTLSNEVNEVVSSYSYVTSYELEGENNNCLTVYVTDSFNELYFEDIYDFFSRIDSSFRVAYQGIMPGTDELLSEKVVCGTTIYTYQDGNTLLKDGSPFDRDSFYRAKFIGRGLSDAELDMLPAISDSALNEALALEDDDECRKEINYQYGKMMYDDGNFSMARSIFQELAHYSYKNTNGLLRKAKIMESVQGTWQKDDEYDYLEIIFNGWKMCISDENLLGSNNYKYKSETGTASIGGSHQIIFTPDSDYGIQEEFYLKKDKLYRIYADQSLQDESSKISEDTTFPNIVELVEPYIGMTAEEVRTKSTWGNPEDINTTVTGRTTYEQWCYPRYKYIYLENGIVTAIQK